MKTRLLPEEVRALLKGAPPRLVNHLRLVHDTAYQLTHQLQRDFPALKFDRDLVLFGAATHGRAGAQPLEDLLVRLADKLWKGQRDQPTEDALVEAVSSELMLDRWDVDTTVDGILTDLAAGADDRLAAR